VDRTPDTVKARIAGMEAEGVLLGYQVVPNLAHLGLHSEAYFARVDEAEDKDQVVEAVGELDRILVLHDYLGDGLCIEFAYEEAAQRHATLAAVEKLTGDPSPCAFYDGVMPEVEAPLSNLDWRILSSLRWEALKPLREVADEVGVTRRTVKRHYDRMAAEGSFVTVPILDPSQAPGLILFELMVFTEPGTDREVANDVLRAYEDVRIFSYVPSSQELGNVNLLAFARTPAQIEELRARGEELPGVERVEAWLFRRFEDHSDWLDDAIAERVRATRP
jgi:DNA-binding Lrp family transcriptional regulator